MLRKTPPLEAIEVFVAAAKSRSFRAVARELALSPSAVSRRIAALESFLGATLFDRSATAIALTPAGRRYLTLVGPAVLDIQNATEELSPQKARPVRVAASVSLSATWLISRLDQLDALFGAEAEVVASRDFDILRSGGADFAIWGGKSEPEDMVSAHVCSPRVAPVCAPRLADGSPPPRSARDLRRCALISTPDALDHWRRWFEANGESAAPERIRVLPNHNLAYEAAAAGLGVALAVPLLVESFVLSGKLAPCGPALPSGFSYRLYRPRRAVSLRLQEQRLLRWLRRETAQIEAIFDPPVTEPA